MILRDIPASPAFATAAPDEPGAAPLRHAIVGHDRDELDRLRQPSRSSALRPCTSTIGGLLARISGLLEPGAERAGLRRAHDVVDLIIEPQARERLLGLALRRERPDQLVLVGESCGTGTRKMKRLRRGRKCVGWP